MSDLLFSDVIDAHLIEDRKSNGDEDEEERVIHDQEERVETLVSNTEAEILLQQVISAAEYDEEVGLDGTFSFVNSNLKGSRLGKSEWKSDMGASSSGTIKDLVLSEPNQEITPQLVVRLGPCGPIQKQLIPMGFSFTQARFLAWASIMHSKDKAKPNTNPHNVIIRDLEESPGEEKSRTPKRDREDAEEVEEMNSKKLKLEPVRKVNERQTRLAKGKAAEAKRFRELRKLARDKEGRKHIEELKEEERSSTMMMIDSKAEEAGHTQPPKSQ
ncbi:hypothetical protein FCV25MIE_03764 [Fagus crenata]